MIRQVELIRSHVLRYVSQSLRLYVSGLEHAEMDVLQRLHGPEGAKTAMDIADYVLQRLGHVKPSEYTGEGPRPRGRPPKAQAG